MKYLCVPVCVLLMLVLSIRRGVALEKLYTDESLIEVVQRKSYVIVFFYQSPCESERCRSLKAVATSLDEFFSESDISVVQMANAAATNWFGFGDEPHVVFYRETVPILVDDSVLSNTEELSAWFEENKASFVRVLDDSNFEHETQAATGATTGDWLVHFYSAGCTDITAVWQATASYLRQQINVAVVNTDTSPELKHRFLIEECPAVVFFRHGKMYDYKLSLYDVSSLVSFAVKWYPNAPSRVVPKHPTPFDRVVEFVIDLIKRYTVDGGSDNLELTSSWIVCVSFLLCFIALVFVFRWTRSDRNAESVKTD